MFWAKKLQKQTFLKKNLKKMLENAFKFGKTKNPSYICNAGWSSW